MNIEQEHIKNIKDKFLEMRSKADFAKLIDETRALLYGSVCKPISLKTFRYYTHHKYANRRYKTFTIDKKSGGKRIIHAPTTELKFILRAVNIILQCVYIPHQSAMGFVNGKSIVDNAAKHINRAYVFNIDLKDFFHSFSPSRIRYELSKPPFNLTGEGERTDISILISFLCTHPLLVNGMEKEVLPQGSPTSPTLTNILCARLDRRLDGLARRFGAVYTRYADDITFSSNRNIFKMSDSPKLNKKGRYDNFMAELKRLISLEKLALNDKKTRLQGYGYRKEVTGLVVNEKVNVHRKYIKQLRMWLYYWDKYGYVKADQIFRRDRLADKSIVKNVNSHLDNVLDGKLQFLKMVKGENDETYLKLKERFNNLIGLKDPINDLLDVWKNEGIEKAMDLYYANNYSAPSNS